MTGPTNTPAANASPGSGPPEPGEEPVAKPVPGDPAGTLPPDAPEGVRKAARADAELSDVDEEQALAWLASGARPLEYKVMLQFDTPDGTQDIPWRVKSMDGDAIDKIEKNHRIGDSGTFNFEMDDKAANIDLIVEATVFPDVRSQRFRTIAAKTDRGEDTTHEFASPQDAVAHYFKFQSGLIAGLGSRIREVSGWNPDRVGRASKVLVNVVGNS